MLLTRQNRLLPILGIVMGLLFILVLQRACTESPQDAVLLEDVPQVSGPDADTPTDTLNTLTANVAAMTAELRQLRADNESLLAQRRAAEEAIETRVADAISDYEQNNDDSGALSELQRRLDEVSDVLAQQQLSGDSDLPLGLGLYPNEISNETIWIEPLDKGAVSSTSAAESTVRPTGERSAPKRLQPAFTVPRNATLMGSTAMTALLGRVPIRGQVRDAMPFKVITGRDNLTANGFTIPGIAGMVWSGTAIGDWTLSCVSGQLHSVTYVFADGSIQTISSDEGNQQQGSGKRDLGWISDERGVPCIGGARKSNAAAFLSQRIGSKAFEAAAEAAAAAQTTTLLRDAGGISTAVDGDTTEFVLGKTLANGSAEISAWLAERQSQNFDAVFVPAGAAIVIHVDRELAIDLDPNGRKLDYEDSTLLGARHRLD